MINNKFGLLSGNILKIFGCIAMFIDHLGFLVFPNIQILRIIGRLSYPIFAFMLAEGCFYTKNRFRHFYVISLFGIVFQIVYYLVMEYIDLSIFIIFSFSILLIYLFDYAIKILNDKKYFIGGLLILSFILSICLLYYIDTRYYYFDYSYGIMGILTPVIIYIFRKYITENIILLVLVTIGSLLLLTIHQGNLINLYLITGALFLLLYNGKKGKVNLKYFFYLFYPAHIVIVYILYLLF